MAEILAVPIPPAREFSFQSWTSANPTTPQPGDKLDLEFDRSNSSVAEVIARLAVIQRDDGQLANNSVGVDQLQPSLIAFGSALPLGGDGLSWDAHGFPIQNVSPGANPTDAVNKQQLDGFVSSLLSRTSFTTWRRALLDKLVDKSVLTESEADALDFD